MTESSEFDREKEFFDKLDKLVDSDSKKNPLVEDFSFLQNKTVFITGNTGFKGSWLTMWLLQLGAKVIGYSLDPPTAPSLYELCGLKEKITQISGDVRDIKLLQKTLDQYQPEVLFHLAAQPLVLHSFEDPLETFETNVLGTVHLLESLRNKTSVRAAILVTSDKCYENQEWIWGYREIDRLGGSDPYSASKAMAEIAIQSYVDSFFQSKSFPAVASVRAGNVIGGGDFSINRLIPDCVRALGANTPIQVRNPTSIRSWIYVLDVLYGYLILMKRLLMNGKAFSGAWNFGPRMDELVVVSDVVETVIDIWGEGDWIETKEENLPREAQLLRLNSDKATALLGWSPFTFLGAALEETVGWYQEFLDQEDMFEVCLEQIDQYHNSIISEPTKQE